MPPTPTATAAARSSWRKRSAARRDRVVYATKFGYDFYTPRNVEPGAGSSRYRTISRRRSCGSALEESLRRLQTDYVDIYQMHNARMAQIEDDALWELLESFKREGKIRMYGVALGPAIGWLYEGVDAVRKRNVASLQMIWNVLEQYPGNEQIRAAYEAGADTGYMIRVPHSSGMLEGHYTDETVFPEGRPPPPPAALVADQRHQKGRAAAVSRAPRAHARAGRDRSGCCASRA